MYLESSPVVKNPDLDQYLQYIADLDLTTKQKYELLLIVHGLIAFCIDAAFSAADGQITWGQLDTSSFSAPLAYDTFGTDPETRTALPRRNGGKSDSSPIGATEP